jgi:hypothetical protein
MNTRKKETWLAFVLGCVMSLAFAVATVLRPNILFIGFLVTSVAVTLFGAYRLFSFSDDLYRAQEEKEQRWYAQHPYLTVLLLILGVGGFLWQLFEVVRRFLR